MPDDLRSDLEALRDDLAAQLSDPVCVHGSGEYAYQRITALLAKHAKAERVAPAEPDLRTVVDAARSVVFESINPHGFEIPPSRASIERLRKALTATEPKEWLGRWKCEKCGHEFVSPLSFEHGNDPNGTRMHHHKTQRSAQTGSPLLCDGTLIPYERRKP